MRDGDFTSSLTLTRRSQTVFPLETDVDVLWERWASARVAHIEHPTPAHYDACIENFKPYFIKVVGKGWQEKLDEAMAEERRRCNQIMATSLASIGGGNHGQQ